MDRFSSMVATVNDVNLSTGKATVLDSMGRNREIRADLRRGGGPYPRPGDIWIIEQMNPGEFIFGTLIQGNPPVIFGDTGGIDALDNTLAALDAMGFIDDQTVSSGSSGRMPGEMVMWPSATIPAGWLLCNGQLVSRTTYADLFAICGTTYGAGNGSTTFALPDFRDRSPLGAGTVDLGEKTGTLDHLHSGAAHTHTVASHDHSINPPNTATTSDAHSHTTAHTHSIDPPSTNSGAMSTGAFVGAGGGGTAYLAGDHVHAINIGSFTSGGASANSGSDTHSHTVDIGAFDSGGSGTLTSAGASAGNTGTSRHAVLGINVIIKT